MATIQRLHARASSPSVRAALFLADGVLQAAKDFADDAFNGPHCGNPCPVGLVA